MSIPNNGYLIIDGAQTPRSKKLMITLSSVSWIIFVLATLALGVYGVRNRKYLTYHCQISQRFNIGMLGWMVLGVVLLMVNAMMNPPSC